MLRSAGARRLRKTLRRCPAGAKIAQRITSWTWDVTHERALSPVDLFGGKAPVGALIGFLERICWRTCSSSAFFMCLCDYLPFLVFGRVLTRLDSSSFVKRRLTHRSTKATRVCHTSACLHYGLTYVTCDMTIALYTYCYRE